MGKKLKSKSFSEALKEAGLLHRPIAWGSDGSLSLGPELTDEERQKLIDVYKSYEAPADEPDTPAPPMPMPPPTR